MMNKLSDQDAERVLHLLHIFGQDPADEGLDREKMVLHLACCWAPPGQANLEEAEPLVFPKLRGESLLSDAVHFGSRLQVEVVSEICVLS